MKHIQDKTIILGVDPGLADTGYGVIIKDRSNKLQSLVYGSIATSKDKNFSVRLELIYNELTSIIKKYKPDIISVEQLFYFKNIKTAMAVSHARGVILLAAKKNKIYLIEFTPLQIKQAVSSYGQADKKQVQKMVKIILNLKEVPRPDDAADALAAAICAANSAR